MVDHDETLNLFLKENLHQNSQYLKNAGSIHTRPNIFIFRIDDSRSIKLSKYAGGKNKHAIYRNYKFTDKHIAKSIWAASSTFIIPSRPQFNLYNLINIAKSQYNTIQNDDTFGIGDTCGIDDSLTVVDTPGYGDTVGMTEDDKITKKIKHFFDKKIQSIDAVCFVIRAPQARLEATQKYVFNKVLELFGKDIKDNIFGTSDGTINNGSCDQYQSKFLFLLYNTPLGAFQRRNKFAVALAKLSTRYRLEMARIKI